MGHGCPFNSAINPKKYNSEHNKKKITKEHVQDNTIIEQPISVEEIKNIEDPTVIEEPKTEASFSNMANAWLNREKPIVTEQDKKVKSVIKDLGNPKSNKEASVKVVDKPVVENSKKEETNEKDIKIKAILNNTSK